MPRPAATTPSLITQLTPAVMSEWLPDALLDDARDDVERGRVARPKLGLSAISAVVADDRKGRVRVRLEWGVGGPVSSCECGVQQNGACRHAAALGLMLVGGAMPRASAQREGAPGAVVDVAERERGLRRERGMSDLFKIVPAKDARIYGRYDVDSPSSRSYGVVIRALDLPHNGCTCPDFATNLLATCKHIEAVLHFLRTKSARRLAKAQNEGPPSSYLTIAYAPKVQLRVRLARDATRGAYLFVKQHASAGVVVSALSAQLLDEAARAGIEVPGEVSALLLRGERAAARAAAAREVAAEVRRAGCDQPGFRATLYPYQVEGVAFLAARGRALLADDMGLGKTAQAICAMVRLARRENVRRTLIVCPASLKHQWLREIGRFTSMKALIVEGPAEARRRAYADPAEVLITSYELARVDERSLAALELDLLILDEAQRIKNWRTRTADSVKRIPSRFAFVLTGTPLENRLEDLYSIMQVVDQHFFGPLWRFQEEFTELDAREKIVGYKNLDRLRARLTEVMLRRRKEEVLSQLPERIVNRLTVPMTAAQREIHDDAESSVARLLQILKRRPLIPQEEIRLVRNFARMRMACDAAGLVDKETVGAPKLDELLGLLDEICVLGGHKVVVFSEWERMQEMGAELCERLGVRYVRLHGGVPVGARGKLIDRFRDDPACKVFFSTDAGGVGLNLQAASHLINLDLPWNPAVLEQRIARVHRLGQSSAVNVVLLVSEHSFEEKMETTLAAKRALFAAAVGDDETTTTIARSTLASRIATLLGGEFAAATGSPAVAPAPAKDPLIVLREQLGDKLLRVVKLPDGRLLGVVRGELPEAQVPALLLSARAAEGLATLGDASPLAQAEELYRAEPAAPPNPMLEARRAHLGAAERKSAAARALVAAGHGAEALALFRAALGFACRAAAERIDPGEDSAALLAAVYSELIPQGALTVSDAHALVRAGELARAFASSNTAPPEALVQEVERDVVDLLGRVRERVPM